MTTFDAVDTDRILAGDGDWIDESLLARLSEHPLECLGREFPHFRRSIDSPDDVERPAERPPVFYGCFDGYSAVHSPLGRSDAVAGNTPTPASNGRSPTSTRGLTGCRLSSCTC